MGRIVHLLPCLKDLVSSLARGGAIMVLHRWCKYRIDPKDLNRDSSSIRNYADFPSKFEENLLLVF